MQNIYSRGKLLLTGEYVVLDGALALALPTKFGQSLKVQPINTQQILWKSFDDKKQVWFECYFEIANNKIIPNLRNETSMRLADILNAAHSLNKDFLKSGDGLQISTELEFPRSWGLGSSSTLINNIANWAQVDPYRLLALTFGGSGYDIACAQSDSPIIYQLQGNTRHIEQVNFNPPFSDHLFFVHLNQKQDSGKAVSKYKLQKKDIKSHVSSINDLTESILNCTDFREFEKLISHHEQIISDVIKTKPVKETLFNEFKGAVKSLGAWGGDFILATGNLEDMNYFKEKGYPTIISFKNMIL